MNKEEMIDLLRSLSIIDGVAMTCDTKQGKAIVDQLEWAVDFLLRKLKEEK